jgi:hypothetical protein
MGVPLMTSKMKNQFLSLLSQLLFPVFAATAADGSPSVKYELNSEAVTLKENDGYQADFKLLLGVQLNYRDDFYTRLSVGANSQSQYSKAFGASRKLGPVFQFKQNLYKEYLFFSYEYFTFYRDGSSQIENKAGFFGGYTRRVNQPILLDSYAEVFSVREVSAHDLLVAARVSLLIDSGWTESIDQVSGLIEVYHKSGPENWGGSYSDLRFGVRLQPWNFLSFKLFSPVLTTETHRTSYLEGQINIFYTGGFGRSAAGEQ